MPVVFLNDYGKDSMKNKVADSLKFRTIAINEDIQNIREIVNSTGFFLMKK